MDPKADPSPYPKTVPSEDRTDDLTDLTLVQAARAIEARAISPVELTAAYLDRIARLDPTLNAFITVTGDRAMQQAQRAEADIAKGGYRGALHGVPIALKDAIDVRGVPTTVGSPMMSDNVPERDAFIVDRLQAMGAVVLGKLNLHEWSWGTTNINPFFGACRNPWDTAHVTGGSSGGAAAAVASAMCVAAVGCDTGGSVRIPASFCGVVGLKPTYGSVSVRGVVPLSWSLDHVGPLGRSVADVAAFLPGLVGYDTQEPTSRRRPKPFDWRPEERDLRGWRVAVLDRGAFPEVDDDVWQAFIEAARVLQSLGCELSDVELPAMRGARSANQTISAVETWVYHSERFQASPDAYGADVRARFEAAALVSRDEYVTAKHRQVVERRAQGELLDRFDLLVTPSTPIAAPAIDASEADGPPRSISTFVSPFNLTGFPALSLPCGFTAEGLPIGLQIVGNEWEEARVLEAGYRFERATPWHARRPELAAA